jgi:type I restriction enzyme S subunit
MTRKSAAKNGSNAINGNHDSPSSHNSHSPERTSPGDHQAAVVKTGWVEKRLGEVCEYINGKAHEQCIVENGRFIVINSKFISSDGVIIKRSNHALLPLIPGDISMVLSDVPNGKALAKCFLVEKPNMYTLNQRICVIRSPNFHTKFLFYQLNRNLHFLSFDNGENQTNLRLNQILSCPLYIPPLPEQQRIVKIFDEAFAGLATAKANAEKNLTNARELFESHLQAVFSQKGDGWVEKRLGEVCEYINGKAHEQCIDESGRFIVINSKFISSNGDIFKRSHHALLPLIPGDISMVLSDVPNGKALAKCFLVEQPDKFTLNQRICVIRSTQFYTKFLYYQLNRNSHFLSFDNGENQTNLRLNQVLSCPLYIPPKVEQQNIAQRLDAISQETQHLESIYRRKLDALDELKKALLHKAFNGEL